MKHVGQYELDFSCPVSSLCFNQEESFGIML